MNTPLEVKFFPDCHLITWHPHGVLNSDRVSKIVAFLEDEEQGPNEPFDRFTDLSWLMAIDLDFEYVVRVSMHRRRAFMGHEPVKSAFLATDPEVIRLAKVHATLTDRTPLEVGVFSELAEAAAWLGVPVEVLVL